MEDRREARKATSAAIMTGAVTKTKDSTEAKAKVMARSKLDIATTSESKGTSE